MICGDKAALLTVIFLVLIIWRGNLYETRATSSKDRGILQKRKGMHLLRCTYLYSVVLTNLASRYFLLVERFQAPQSSED